MEENNKELTEKTQFDLLKIKITWASLGRVICFILLAICSYLIALNKDEKIFFLILVLFFFLVFLGNRKNNLNKKIFGFQNKKLIDEYIEETGKAKLQLYYLFLSFFQILLFINIANCFYLLQTGVISGYFVLFLILMTLTFIFILQYPKKKLKDIIKSKA